jgi:hypothetical protein
MDNMYFVYVVGSDGHENWTAARNTQFEADLFAAQWNKMYGENGDRAVVREKPVFGLVAPKKAA